MATPEAKVKHQIKKLLTKYGAWYYMPVSMGMGKHGIPDFICCMEGIFFAVEAKAGNKQPTDLQKMQLEKIRTAGGMALVINEDNLNELEFALSRLAAYEVSN